MWGEYYMLPQSIFWSNKLCQVNWRYAAIWVGWVLPRHLHWIWNYFQRTALSWPINENKSRSLVSLCNSMGCSLPGSSVHGIFQARILEWVTVPFSRGSSQPRDQTQVSHIAGRFFTMWATREAHKHLTKEKKPLCNTKMVGKKTNKSLPTNALSYYLKIRMVVVLDRWIECKQMILKYPRISKQFIYF